MSESGFIGPKAKPEDLFGRFREIVSDPLNLLIERRRHAGGVFEGDAFQSQEAAKPRDDRGG
jgi:hypothetical protein